jgi:hypothetical protein
MPEQISMFATSVEVWARVQGFRVLCVAMLLLPVMMSCSARAGWQRPLTSSDERDIQEMALLYLLSDLPTWLSEREPAYVCVGVGRRVEVGIRDRARGTEWDPTPGFLMRFEGVSPAIVPLSQCGWEESLEVVHSVTGDPALAVGIPQVTWETDQHAQLVVLAQDEGFVTRRYSCYFRKPYREWLLDECLFTRGRLRRSPLEPD